MKDFLSKTLSLFRQNTFIIPITLLILLLSAGYGYMWFVKEREVHISLQNTTKVIESMWLSVTTAHEETMRAYFNHYVMDQKTIDILKNANSDNELTKKIARTNLFRHLSDAYMNLRSKLYVRQLHFHLPNNQSFLRFHAPNFYGDDLTPHRSTIVMTNKLLKPHFAFETGRVITGYRYVFPIIDLEGKHLGSVELSRPFEVLRQTLSEIDKNTGYTLLIRQDDLMAKILEDYKRLYNPIPDLTGWVFEDPRGELPDTVTALDDEYKGVFESAKKNRDFIQLLQSPTNATITLSYKGNYYKITGIKLFDFNQKHAATLLGISKAYDITDTMERFKRDMFLYTILISGLCVTLLLYFKEAAKTKRKQYELELITSTMGSGLYVTDKNGTIIFANDAAAELLGYTNQELVNSSAHDTFHSHAGAAEQCPILMAIKNGINYNSDDVFKRKDNTFIDVHVICRPMREQKSLSGAVIVFTDITDLKRMQNEIYIMSITDPLTGLYNRRFMLEMLMNTKHHSDRHAIPFSLLMIDIDKFKSINDTYGHDIGDEVLVKVATTLKESIRTSDVASRWGGEEFLILLANTTLKGAITAAEKIREGIKAQKLEPIQNITVSIGVTSYESPEDLKDTISRADKALYQAKANGRDCVCHESK